MKLSPARCHPFPTLSTPILRTRHCIRTEGRVRHDAAQEVIVVPSQQGLESSRGEEDGATRGTRQEQALRVGAGTQQAQQVVEGGGAQEAVWGRGRGVEESEGQNDRQERGGSGRGYAILDQGWGTVGPV